MTKTFDRIEAFKLVMEGKEVRIVGDLRTIKIDPSQHISYFKDGKFICRKSYWPDKDYELVEPPLPEIKPVPLEGYGGIELDWDGPQSDPMWQVRMWHPELCFLDGPFHKDKAEAINLWNAMMDGIENYKKGKN